MLPGRIRWLNAAEPPNVAALTATGPLLVHFFDFAQLNSVRALSLRARVARALRADWACACSASTRPGSASPPSAALDAGVAALGVDHPVADDAQYAIWHDYGCKGWPSLFLWGRGGALRWFHFGEGEYSATEEAIAEELRAEDITLRLPQPMAPIRPSDAPGALVVPPSAEHFPGGSPATPGAEPGQIRLEIDIRGGRRLGSGRRRGELRWWLDGERGRQCAPSGPAPDRCWPSTAGHKRHSLRIEATRGSDLGDELRARVPSPSESEP